MKGERMREREGERENESEWTTVVRRKGKQREGERLRVDPKTNYNNHKLGQFQRYHHHNWRDKDDITTFYFTSFHEHITEEDLWAQFKKWGDMREIFINKHRNKGGRRFGFARFKGVLDKYRLEKQLDNILDGLKMYVNVPKYGRGKGRVKEGTSKPGILKEGHSREVEVVRHRAGQYRNPQKSYAKVVSTIQTDAGKMKHPKLPQQRYVESHSSIHLQVAVGEKKWFTDAWVGRLKKLRALERIEDDIPWELAVNVVPKYLGDDLVLLLGLADDKAEHIIAEETQNGTSPFHSLERWNPTLRSGHRLVWAQCWGIPIEAWDLGNIRKIAAAIGELVEVDDDVEEMRRMDRARILIRTPWKPFFHHAVSVTIGEELHQVYDLRRQPNNPYDDPEAVADNDGGPHIGTGIPIGRATNPPEANHSVDSGGNPLKAAHVQLTSRRRRPDEDTDPVATNNPRPPLSKGSTVTENPVDNDQGSWVIPPNLESGVRISPKRVTDHQLLTPPPIIQNLPNVEDGPNNGVGLPQYTTTNSSNQNNVGPMYPSAEGNKQWKVFSRRKGCKQQMAQKNLSNGKVTKSLFPEICHHTQSIGTATSKRPKEANSQIPVKSIGADEGQIEEPLTQWELAKLMGVSTDSEQTTIIHKIIDMETRDKKEAEDLGLGRGVKWAFVRRLVRKHKVDILCIQETKKEQIDKPTCQALWGDMDVVWEFQPAVNTAGGLLCIWNEQVFKVERRVKGTGYILLEGVWTHENQRIFINVKTIKSMLRVFELASDLKINFAKSSFGVIGKSDHWQKEAAEYLNCRNLTLPFLYLGIPIGDNPRRSELIRDRLPTKKNLSRRQVVMTDVLCPFCRNREEEAAHLFFTCSNILPLWWETMAWINISTAMPQHPRDHYLQHGHGVAEGKKSTRWKCWWIALTYTIWQHRNKIVFQNATFDEAKLMDDAVLFFFLSAKLLIKTMEKDFGMHFNQWSSNLKEGFRS
ncbi:hypothetical protein HKD37_01G000613 [Glycine soja]